MDFMIDLQEKYVKVKRLIEDESKKDPESEPYRSKYKAKALLSEMKSLISDKLDATDSNDTKHRALQGVLALVLLNLGIIALDTEELSTGEELLVKCLETVPEHSHSDFVLVSMSARNQLGILWSQRGQPEKAKTYLEDCEEVYETYMGATPFQAPKKMDELLEASEESVDMPAEKEIENIHTLTKFYLAQVYGTLKNLVKSAMYCHETLRRQLEQKQYDPIDWALNSATLSQFFMEQILFKQARHHLAAASCILDKHEETLKQEEGTEEELEAKKEEFLHRSADVSRCWAKYGIFLLEHSKNRLSDSYVEVLEERPVELQELWFGSLEVSVYENQVLDTPVLVFEEARAVFLNVQKHLNRAKEYYSLEDHASEHVQVVQDHSHLFQHLAAFEMDEERQYKMMRKRAEMLEAVLKELNPQYYLLVCRQLWFELGECYHDMMHVKYQKIKDSTEVPSPQALKKVNALSEQSIVYFNHFLRSVREKASDALPATLAEDLVRPVLIAHFYLGRLYYKLFTQDKRRQLENTTKAHECYKYLVDYCEQHPEATERVVEEHSVSNEMMTLLRMKAIQIDGQVAV